MKGPVRWRRMPSASVVTICPRRQDCDESRPSGGQAPDQASSGRQTGAAAHARTDHSQGTHKAASHPTSHTRHGDNQAGERPRQTPSPSLTVTQVSAGWGADVALVEAVVWRSFAGDVADQHAVLALDPEDSGCA